jgi:hypothetical protein
MVEKNLSSKYKWTMVNKVMMLVKIREGLLIRGGVPRS